MDVKETNTSESPKVEGKAATDSSKAEVSASTIARMMGVATTLDLKLVEGKLELMATKINALTAKMERVITGLNGLPSASDLDRVDIQIGSLKTMLREIIAAVTPSSPSTSAKGKEKEPAEAAQPALRDGIQSSATENK